jgi:hypothetical protein
MTLFEKLNVTQLVKKYPALAGNVIYPIVSIL